MPFEGEDLMVKMHNLCDNGHEWDSVIGAEFLPRHLTKLQPCRTCGSEHIRVEPFELVSLPEAVAWLREGAEK